MVRRTVYVRAMPETVPVDRESELQLPQGQLYAQMQRPDSVFVHPARLATTDLDGKTDVSYEPSIEVGGRRYFVRTWFTYVDGTWILGADRRPSNNPAWRLMVEEDNRRRRTWPFRHFIWKRESKVAERIVEPLVELFRKWADENGDMFAYAARKEEIEAKQRRLLSLRNDLKRANGFVEGLPDRHRQLDEEADRYREQAASLETTIADLEAEVASLQDLRKRIESPAGDTAAE